MRTLISAFPDVGRDEFEAGLAAALARRGVEVVERLEHARGEVVPALANALARRPGTRALIFFESEPVGLAAPTIVLHEHGGPPTRWEPGLTQALSRTFGGWAWALLSDRQRDDFGGAVFYAGRSLERVHWSAGAALQCTGVPAGAARLDEAGAWATFVARHRSIGGGLESDLRWSDRTTTVRSWLVGPSTAAAEPAPAEGLRRAMFIDVDAARGRSAVDALAGAASALRCGARIAPVTGTPCFLVDGGLDDAAFVALTGRLEAEATAVALAGDGDGDGRFTWCEVRSGREPRAGSGQGADALARVWNALTIMLGEPASIVRCPD